MTTRRTRFASVAAVACAAAVLLTGCQAVDPTALRLNEDGSFDFGTCVHMSSITGGTAVAYIRGKDYNAGLGRLTTDDLPEAVASGDVIHLPAPGTDDWDRVQIVIDGDYTSRAGETYATTLSGLFERGNLEIGEWSWARSGVFIGTVAVDGCDLDG